MSTDDLDDMGNLLGDPGMMEYYPHPKDREEAAAWIDWNLRNYAEHGHGLWAIETHDGEFLGDCGLTWQRIEDSVELEVGFHVKTSAQSCGYATEAAAACRDFARSRVPADRLIAIIHEDNRASRRVAEKIGMNLGEALTHASSVHVVYSMAL